jgi:hypothetical protein
MRGERRDAKKGEDVTRFEAETQVRSYLGTTCQPRPRFNSGNNTVQFMSTVAYEFKQESACIGSGESYIRICVPRWPPLIDQYSIASSNKPRNCSLSASTFCISRLGANISTLA